MLTLEYIKSKPDEYRVLYEWYCYHIVCDEEPDWHYYTEYASERLTAGGFELVDNTLTAECGGQGSGAAFGAVWSPYAGVKNRHDMDTEKWLKVIADMNEEHSLFTDYMPMYAALAAGLDFVVEVVPPSRGSFSAGMTTHVGPEDLWYGDSMDRASDGYDWMPETASFRMCPPILKVYEGVDMIQLCEAALPMLDDLADDALYYCQSVADDVHSLMQGDIDYRYSDEAFEEWVEDALSYDADTVEAAWLQACRG